MTAAELRRIAEAATKGPWEWERPSEDDFPQHDQSLVTTWKEEDGHPATVLHSWGYDASGTEAEPQDRLFIATFNPQRVLELLDENERLESVVREQARILDGRGDRLAAVEKLHQPVEAVAATGATITVCWKCAGDLSHVFDGQVNWPCPTIKAVRGE